MNSYTQQQPTSPSSLNSFVVSLIFIAMKYEKKNFYLIIFMIIFTVFSATNFEYLYKWLSSTATTSSSPVTATIKQNSSIN